MTEILNACAYKENAQSLSATTNNRVPSAIESERIFNSKVQP